MKPIIGIDVDGVLRNFEQSVKAKFIQKYPFLKNKLKKQLTWNLQDSYPEHINISKFIWEENAEDIFTNAKDYTHRGKMTSSEFVSELSKLGEIAIITSQIKGTEKYTLNFLENMNIHYDHIFFTHSKQLINATVLLEDKIENLEIVESYFVKAICFDQHWNKEWKGTRAFNYEDAYYEIFNYLKKIKQ